MGKSWPTIKFRADRCDGCGDCMTACDKVKGGNGDLAQTRIRILAGTDDTWELALCRQCGDPKCVMDCPSTALTKDGDSGVVAWDASKCVNCLLCTVGCVWAGIVFEPKLGHVSKCDLCDGDPACVKACDKGALEWGSAAEIYNTHGEMEDMFVPGLSACQGCNSELLIRHTMRAVGPDTVLATPPGCIPGMGTVGYNGLTGSKVPVFHPLLTNTASMMAGIKRQYQRMGREVTVMALAGDGGTVDAGFHALSGAAARNDPLLYVCVDNEGYMNTGMQASGSTSFGSWTSTTPVGEVIQGHRSESKNLPLIMLMHNCSYVATASTAFLEDYHDKLVKAREAARHGFAYVHVYAPCPSGWRFASALTTEVCRRQVETNFVTLWEHTPAEGLRFTHSTEGRRPINDYLRLIGKYRHLTDEQVAHIQASVDERTAYLRRFEAPREHAAE